MLSSLSKIERRFNLIKYDNTPKLWKNFLEEKNLKEESLTEEEEIELYGEFCIKYDIFYYDDGLDF